jgi:hypothetical protein
MSDKKDSYMSEDERGYEWHLEYPYSARNAVSIPDCASGNAPQARRCWTSYSRWPGSRVQHRNHRAIGAGWFASASVMLFSR